eukprot:TRINITY_DN452_c0_g1_i1.p2 TRINITY_DN452_c0_g1~~TRINITY_DN452_c0_g1_i1.p2  ORF type:complete len:208 (+),score=28.46 TRINITY_DN452_c0_g1_i1:215-838(+)
MQVGIWIFAGDNDNVNMERNYYYQKKKKKKKKKKSKHKVQVLNFLIYFWLTSFGVWRLFLRMGNSQSDGDFGTTSDTRDNDNNSSTTGDTQSNDDGNSSTKVEPSYSYTDDIKHNTGVSNDPTIRSFSDGLDKVVGWDKGYGSESVIRPMMHEVYHNCVAVQTYVVGNYEGAKAERGRAIEQGAVAEENFQKKIDKMDEQEDPFRYM